MGAGVRDEELTVTAIPDQDWRNTAPLPGPAPALNLPIPRKFRLGNGLNVFLVEQHSLPIVSANVITLSGSDQNPPGQPGLASFTAEMLDEGTGKRSPLEIAADSDQIGASLSTGSSTDYSFVAARTLKKNVDAAFELVSDILLNPAFAPEEIERIRHDRCTHILQQKDSPNVLAVKVFFDAVYGSSHPYGYMDIGTEESNQAISRDLLLNFYRTGYFAPNSALVVAGDITEAELGALAEKYFGGWGRWIFGWVSRNSPMGPPQYRPPLLVVTSRKADDTLWSEVLNLGGYDVLAQPYERAEVVRILSLAWLHWKTSMSGPARQLAACAS